MIKTLAISTIIIIQSIQTLSFKNYTNYGVYKVVPSNSEQLMFLKNIAERFEIDFWNDPGLLNMSVQFSVSESNKERFLTEVATQKLNISVITENVQSLIDKQNVKPYYRSNVASFDWSSFRTLNDIYQWLNDMAFLHKDVLTLYNIGKSEKGRIIYCCEIIHKSGYKRSNVIVDGGIHAREWITPAFVTYMLNTILEMPNAKNESLKHIAESYNWYFVPVLNPDGYEYTHTKDRLWRKNRRRVDLNRNFDAKFGTVGVRDYDLSENYPGEYAFSEAETRALRFLFQVKGKRVEYYFSFHSFGQRMIIPYEYSKEHFKNYGEVKEMARRAAKKIEERYGKKYFVGTLYEALGYLASGSSASWVKEKYKVPYVLTFELRDEGEHGFLLPAEEILPTCIETMDAMVSLLQPSSRKKLMHTSSSVSHFHNFKITVIFCSWFSEIFILFKL